MKARPERVLASSAMRRRRHRGRTRRAPRRSAAGRTAPSRGRSRSDCGQAARRGQRARSPMPPTAGTSAPRTPAMKRRQPRRRPAPSAGRRRRRLLRQQVQHVLRRLQHLGERRGGAAPPSARGSPRGPRRRGEVERADQVRPVGHRGPPPSASGSAGSAPQPAGGGRQRGGAQRRARAGARPGGDELLQRRLDPCLAGEQPVEGPRGSGRASEQRACTAPLDRLGRGRPVAVERLAGGGERLDQRRAAPASAATSPAAPRAPRRARPRARPAPAAPPAPGGRTSRRGTACRGLPAGGDQKNPTA